MHCGQLALTTEDLPKDLQNEKRIHRNVVYVCMVPMNYANQNSLEMRKTIFEEKGTNRLRSATHRAHEMKLFQVPTPDVEVPKMEMPLLNERAKKLAGIL